MSSKIKPVFRVGDLYTHAEIFTQLKVGNAGGIRPSISEEGAIRRLVVMTTGDPTAKLLRENPYHDRVERDVLVYTAAGLEGDQAVAGINRRLLEQNSLHFPIFGFSNIGSRRDEKLGQRRWRFLGLLQYLRHFNEQQIDSRGQLRKSLVFELLIHSYPTEIPLDVDYKVSMELCRKRINRDGSERVQNKGVPVIRADEIDPILAENVRRSLLAVSPERFEHVIKETLESSGFEQVAVTRFSGDGGIDVNAYAGVQLWPCRGGMLQVQAKRWLHTVGRREVAELRGSMQPHSNGAVVTTSFFSKAAIAEAVAPSKKPIVLVDGLELAAVIIRNGSINKITGK